MLKVMITGSQGSGKTTQAKIIAHKLSFCFVKTGDLIRSKAKDDDKTGKTLKKSLDKGELADDAIVAFLLKKELQNPKCQAGVVIDGYPRRLSQLKYFDPQIDLVFFLRLKDEQAIQRMLKRGREDDTLKLIKTRLKNFHHLTEEVLNYYQSLGKLIIIGGDQEVEKVSQDILDTLKDYVK